MATKKKPSAPEGAKVSFTKLMTERGSARAVPSLVRDLADPEKSAVALRKLADLLIPFDRINEATGPALRLVIEALRNATPARGNVGALALHLAEIDRPEALAAFGMDPSRPELAARYGVPPGASIRTSIDESLDTLVALADDDDPRVRLVGVRLLGYARAHAGIASPRVVERLRVEEDARVVPWAMISAYHLALALDDHTALSEAVDAAAKRVATPVAVGVASVVRASLRQSVVGVDVGTIAAALHGSLDPWATADQLRPWGPAFIDETLLSVLGGGPLGREGRLVGARAVIQLGRALGDSVGGLWRSNMRDAWSQRVLRWFFMEGPAGHKTLYESPLSAADLDASQREILSGLSSFENDLLGSTYMYYGLPQDRRSRLRLLGELPPSALERDVAPGQPLSRVVLHAYDELKSKDAFLERLAPFIEPLSKRERLDLWTELLANAYERQTFGLMLKGDSVLSDEVSTASREEVMGWADGYLGADALRFRDVVEGVGYHIVEAVVSKLAPAEELPDRFDALLTMFGSPARLRAIFARISGARTLRIFERALAHSTMDSGTCCERAAQLSDLHPALADAVLQHYAAVGRSPISNVREAFAEARQANPELDDLLRRAGA